jgi:hypothetical protein
LLESVPNSQDFNNNSKYAQIDAEKLAKIDGKPSTDKKYYAVSKKSKKIIKLAYVDRSKESEAKTYGTVNGDDGNVGSSLDITKKHILPFSPIFVINPHNDDDASYTGDHKYAEEYTFYETVDSSTSIPSESAGGSKLKTRKQTRRVRNARSKKYRCRRS